MTDEANPAPAGRAAQGGIPLNLAPLLTPYGQHQRLTIRVVYLPPRAELTRGKRNEDASWSLTPAELDGLELILPDDGEPPPSVGVRIVGIDRNENASIVGQFEVPLPRSTRAKSGAGADPALLAALQQRLDRRAAAAKRLADRKVALALAEAQAAWQARDAAGQAEATQKSERKWQRKIAAEQDARQAAEARAEEVAQQAAALTGELEAARARAAEAEAASNAKAPQPSGAEIEARIATEVEARLAAARAEWECEAQSGDAAARKRAVQEAVAAARQQAESEAAAHLEEARIAWQAEAAAELDAARAAWPQDATEALETARAELAGAQAAAQEVAQDVAGLREQLAATETTRRDLDITRKELAVAQVAVQNLEALRKELAAAQTAAAKLEAGLAEAKTQAAREIETRLANQEQVLELEWREKLLGERGARQAAEAKAAEAVQQLAPLTAELEAARLRIGAAEAAAAAAAGRESELQRQVQEAGAQAEARLARELETRLAAARTEWQAEQGKQDDARLARELEARIAASEANWESNRQRDGEARIAAAVDQAVKKAEIKAQTRLEQARADWEKELRAALAIAEGKWQAEAATRLAAAHAEWNKNSEMELARGRSKLRGAARRQWRAPAWRLVKRTAFAAACATAVFLLVTQFKPLVREYLDFGRWKPKVMAMVDDVKSTALEEYESLTGTVAAHRTVAAELANVRSGPSTDSDIVARLPRNTEVTVLERRGAWIRVPVESAGAGEGWLHETLLDGATR
jgi:hypothetical protein